MGAVGEAAEGGVGVYNLLGSMFVAGVEGAENAVEVGIGKQLMAALLREGVEVEEVVVAVVLASAAAGALLPPIPGRTVG
ncbi:hypothetical protein BDZ91DRAFT_723055 [Kalaharituber pfeilii]|nr:hypothetical protein BDZ91DRAFT_723055 [Kalaharituber pfeilii]